jgi:hypothetical protein
VLHSNSHPERQAVSELLLLAIRSAVLRAQTIGTALSTGMIKPASAVQWLADIGLVDQVIAEQVQS